MDCDQIEELLSDLIDDELAAGARAGVEAHVASCGRCGETYRQLRRTVRFVRANAAHDAKPGEAARVYEGFIRAVVTAGDDRAAKGLLRDAGFEGEVLEDAETTPDAGGQGPELPATRRDR